MAPGPSVGSQGTAVEKVIEQVKAELAKAGSAAPHLRLTQFDLELSVVVKKKGEAKFEFEVPFLGKLGPSGGGSAATASTTKVTLSFEPPEMVLAEVHLPLEGLPAALATIEQSIHAGEKSSPRLDLTEGEVSFQFGVEKAGSAGVKIVVLSAGFEGSREDAHTITLKFKPKKS
jgi:hypothetical protein